MSGKRRQSNRHRAKEHGGTDNTVSEATVGDQSDDATDNSAIGSRLSMWKIGLLLLVFLLGCFDLENADIWWQLRTGQLIAERGYVPQTDWYTYTNPESEWIDLHWTFQLAIAGLWSIGGTVAIILAKCIIGTLTIAIALWIGRRHWSDEVTVACWLIPVTIFAGRYFARPECVTLLYLTCTLAILYQARANWRWILLLPIVQIFWVNVQGLFVLQFVIMGAFGAEQLLRRISPGLNRLFQLDEIDSPLPLLPMIVIGLITLAASLVNPYGVRGALFPLTLFARVEGGDRDFFLNYAGEFAGMEIFLRENGFAGIFQDITVASLFLLTLLILISFALLLSVRRISLYRVLLFLGFVYLAWQMNRNAVLYAMVGGMILRLNIGQWWDIKSANAVSTRSKRKAAKKSEASQAMRPFWQQPSAIRAFRFGLAMLIGVQIIALPAGLYHAYRKSIFDRQFGLGENIWYPHDGALFLQDPRLPDRIYASHLGVASVAIFHLCPDKKVFADARLETNTRQVLQSHSDVLDRIAAGEEFESLLRAKFAKNYDAQAEAKREVPAILLSNDALISQQGIRVYRNLTKDDRWRCVFLQMNIQPDFTGNERDVKLLSRGEAVFIASEQAKRLRIPAADTSLLEGLMQNLESLAEKSRRLQD